jgi:hypothetical protein
MHRTLAPITAFVCVAQLSVYGDWRSLASAKAFLVSLLSSRRFVGRCRAFSKRNPEHQLRAEPSVTVSVLVALSK